MIAALATVVPQQGMHGARLDMTVGQVRARLGAPDHVAFADHPIIGRVRMWRYDRTRLTFDGDGRDAKVIAFQTTGERLADGIGVGSTREAVRRRVRGARCKAEFGLDHCWVGSYRVGSVVTDFPLRHGKVARIAIGRVID